MMRNHKSERIQFQHPWRNDWLDNYISYLGPINTDDNGRQPEPESILRPQYFIDSEFTQKLEPQV